MFIKCTYHRAAYLEQGSGIMNFECTRVRGWVVQIEREFSDDDSNDPDRFGDDCNVTLILNTGEVIKCYGTDDICVVGF